MVVTPKRKPMIVKSNHYRANLTKSIKKKRSHYSSYKFDTLQLINCLAFGLGNQTSFPEIYTRVPNVSLMYFMPSSCDSVGRSIQESPMKPGGNSMTSIMIPLTVVLTTSGGDSLKSIVLI